MLVLFFSTLGYFHPAHAAIPDIKRAAVIVLYNSTDGDNWTNNSRWKNVPLDIDGFVMHGMERYWIGITAVII
jgi:hypothetical protein